MSLPSLSLGSRRPLAGRLEHRPLDRRNSLLEAGWAGPQEACRGCKLIRELGLSQACITVVVGGDAKAACKQLYGLRITRIWEAGVVITSNYSVITIQV